MKKRKKKKFKTFFGLFILFCALAAIQNYFQHKTQEPPVIVDPFMKVKEYRPLLESELGKYNLEQYTDVLLALMQQESRGQGGDPMQASESAGLARNTIKDPKQSIQAGVKHFKGVLSYGNQQKVDFPTIIQAYNMGSGYITFVAQHGGKHSEELAKQFSRIQAKKEPDLYNCNGDKSNFRYPYCYGDFTYSTKVLKNMHLLVDSIQVNGDDKNKTSEF
ncbi:lysozyme family protein [Neobacillus mesonae]|uniref:lysozyme family protein n=1 Tax=Neobacillus mesonae TaxID=1193713 RepID=UPI002041526B|nr:lysozyme family protein [Neobacillus mesonae]MCM3570184.1 lysozyme family protein [Neobacillus mesonae]